MSSATLTAKGQITIPADVRRQLGLDTGDRIELVALDGGGYAMQPAIDDARALKGLLRKPAKPVSVDDMKQAIRKRGGAK